MVGLILLVVLAPILLACTVVPQSSQYIIERREEYLTTWNAGTHWKTPLVDSVARKVSLRDQVYDFRARTVLTGGGVPITINIAVFFHVTDAKRFAYGVSEPRAFMEDLTFSLLGGLIGNLTLETTLGCMETICTQLSRLLDAEVESTGIKVDRVTIKDFSLPENRWEVLKMKPLVQMAVFVAIVLTLTAGLASCALNPAKVDERYVINEFQKALRRWYGAEFAVEITEFNETSEFREATATVYPEVDPELKCTITGKIAPDTLAGDQWGNSTSYQVKNCGFHNLLEEKMDRELAGRYDFEIGAGADLDIAAENVVRYIDDVLDFLAPYRKGTYYSSKFKEDRKSAEIPLTLDGEDIARSIVIDKSNGRVITDFSAGEYAWQGELEIAEYLQLLRDGKLEERIREIHDEHYS